MKENKTEDHSYKKRDHSFKNEINIKINNSGLGGDRLDKSTNKKDTEEKALKRLNNLEYNNQAILSRSNQGFSRGSGGGIILPFQDNQNFQNHSIISKGVSPPVFKPINTNYQDPNQFSNYSTDNNYSSDQSAFIEFLDDEPLTSQEMEIIKSLPPSQQLLAIEDIKKKRGRPKGSKNKKKVSMETQTEEEDSSTPLQSIFENEDNIKSSVFDNPELRNIKPFGVKDHLARTDKKTKPSNAYTQHLEEKKLSMNQVPPRPDRNEL
jgi:hypothetical protein